jgi:hypothetical protein
VQYLIVFIDINENAHPETRISEKLVISILMQRAQSVAPGVACYATVAQMRCMPHVCRALQRTAILQSGLVRQQLKLLQWGSRFLH